MSSGRITTGGSMNTFARNRRRLLVALVIGAAIAAPATAAPADPEPDPFPVGACVRSTMVDPRPICVMVDPLQ